MPRRITKLEGFRREKQKEKDAFYKLSEYDRVNLACEISEILLRIQYENGVLPKDNNFTLTR
jgi:hypothetical protein